MKTQFLTAITAATALTGIVITADIANAASLSYTAEYQQTEFDKMYSPYQGYGVTDIEDSTLSVKKFDTSLGTLNSITIEFEGSFKQDGKFENKDAKTQTITLTLDGNLNLKLPDGTSLFDLSPDKSLKFDNVSAYDGKTDYEGSSARQYEGLTAETSGEKTYTDSQFVNTFAGTGSVNFSFSAKGTTKFTGSGNVAQDINTYAKAGVKVTYDYTAAPRKIPEASTTLGLGLVAGFGLLSRKKSISKKA